jgi:hypothetical protein
MLRARDQPARGQANSGGTRYDGTEFRGAQNFCVAQDIHWAEWDSSRVAFPDVCGAFHGMQIGTQFILGKIPGFVALGSQAQTGLITPTFGFVAEFSQTVLAFLAAFIMSQIEKRDWFSYGIPIEGAFGKLFWQGIVWGLALVSSEVLIMRALGGFSFGGLALSGVAILKYAAIWGFIFLLGGAFGGIFVSRLRTVHVGDWDGILPGGHSVVLSIRCSTSFEFGRGLDRSAVGGAVRAVCVFLRCGERGICGSRLGCTRPETSPRRLSIRFRTAAWWRQAIS